MNLQRTSLLRALRQDERGLTTVEYAIVLCLIAALAVASWNTFGTMINDKLVGASGQIETNLDVEY